MLKAIIMTVEHFGKVGSSLFHKMLVSDPWGTKFNT